MHKRTLVKLAMTARAQRPTRSIPDWTGADRIQHSGSACVAAERVSLRSTLGTPPSSQSAPYSPATSAANVSLNASATKRHLLKLRMNRNSKCAKN